MKCIYAVLIFATLGLTIAGGAPIGDLSSPDQATRDKAAAELRVTFEAKSEAKWLSTVKKIQKGQSKKEILELLGPEVKKAGAFGSGQSHSQSYRLDDEWILVCWFQNAGDILIDRKLERRLWHIWIAPPSDFTGTWVVYFVNGHKSHQIEYKDGKYFGELIAYRSDGSKSYVQHYTEQGADGEDTGYYPSGRISYRGRYIAGKQVGVWTWYDENGRVTSTREHPEK